MKNSRKSTFTLGLLFVHFSTLILSRSASAISLSISKPNQSTALYKAPSQYGKEKPLQSFIITSRPINFNLDKAQQQGNSFRFQSNSLLTKNKVALTHIPGVATVVCKGVSCSGSGLSFADTPFDDNGFAGEAIPVDDSEYMSVMHMVDKNSLTRPLPVTSSSYSVSKDPVMSMVHLLTNRPYLRSSSLATRKTRRSTTTTRLAPSPITRRQVATTTTAKPAADAPRPVPQIQLQQRPSLFFPALTAFSLMALPVAAAAVPLLLHVAGRRRRSLGSPVPLMLGADFADLASSLEDLENENKQDWLHGLRHRMKVKKARRRMQHVSKHTKKGK